MALIRIFCALVFLVLTGFPALAKQSNLVGKAPDWVIPETFNKDVQLKKESVSDGWLNILTDQQVNIAHKAYFYHYTRKIFSKTGVQNGSEISVDYDPSYQDVKFHFVTIHRDGRQINKLKPARIKVMHRETSRERFIYDGTLTAALTLEDVREGDIIDYALTVTGDNPIFNGKFDFSFSLQQHDPLDKLAIRVITPKNRNFGLKTFGKAAKPQITEDAQARTYTWKLNRVPGLTMDDNTPVWYDPYPWVNISDYRNWQEVNDWALKLFAYPQEKSPQLLSKIDSIKNRYGDANDRITAALQFVQNDIRYLGIESGISSHKPFAPARVFDQRYGDCKDKANLLCFMLNQMDINAWPVLVNTQYRSEVKKWLPGAGNFNHCVVTVQVPGKQTWLDPTIPHQSGPYDQVFFPNYGCGLVLKPGTVALTDIPQNTNSKTVIDEEFTLEQDKAVLFRVETSYHGSEADYQRDFFEANSLADIEKNYLNYYAEMYPGIRKAKELLSSEDVGNNAFLVYENYEIDDFWSSESKKGNEQTGTIYPQLIGSKIVYPKTKIRTMPYALEFPLNLEQTTQVFLLEPWNIEEEDLTIEENGIFFAKKVTLEDANLTIKYIYRTLKPHIEAKDVAAFIATHKKIEKELGYTFTQSGPAATATAAAGPLDDKNPIFIFFFVFGVGAAAVCGYKMYFYDPLPEDLRWAAQPLPVGGWLVLVGLGLAVTPVRVLFQVISADYLGLSMWNSLGNPESGMYNPVLQLVLAGEFMFNLLVAGMAVTLLVLLVKRRTNVPKLMIGFYVLNAAAIVLETVYMSAANLPQGENPYAEMVKSLVAAAIWVPYFLKSKRVKQTFVVMLKPLPVFEPLVAAEIKEQEQPVELELTEEAV